MTMTKPELRAILGNIPLSKLNAALREAGLAGEELFEDKDLEIIRAALGHVSGQQPSSSSSSSSSFQPQDLSPLGLGILSQAIQEERDIAKGLAPYLVQDARINRILAFLGQELASQPREVSVPLIFRSQPIALPHGIDPSLI